MSQWLRVKRLMDKRGPVGVTQVDFLAPTADGGAPILRLAARIYDLKKQGYEITAFGERDGCEIYLYSRYVSSAAALEPADEVAHNHPASTSAGSKAAEPVGLFELLPAPRNAIYEDAA